jgi:hypothetical protein
MLWHILAVCPQSLSLLRQRAQPGKNVLALRRILKLLRIETQWEHRSERLENVAHGSLEAACRGIGRPLRLSGEEEGKTQQYSTGSCRPVPELVSLQPSSHLMPHG